MDSEMNCQDESEVLRGLRSLSDEEKSELCNGDLVLSDNCNITIEIFDMIFKIAEMHATN